MVSFLCVVIGIVVVLTSLFLHNHYSFCAWYEQALTRIPNYLMLSLYKVFV